MKGPLLFIVAAAALLLFDYPNWQARRAERKLSSGDLSGALATLSALEKLPGRGAVASFNRGVVLCRMGNYSAAAVSFQRSAAGCDSDLRSRALYNLGTSRILEAGRAAAALRAEALLKQAVADLEQALALEPSDRAAQANLRLAQGGLVALAKQNRDPAEKPGPQALPGQERTREKRGRQRTPETATAKPGKPTDRQQDGGKRGRVLLDKKEALRMLDDAKGREVLISAKAATDGGRADSVPEKDW